MMISSRRQSAVDPEAYSELINEALHQLRASEPPAGLEARVAARLRTHQRRQGVRAFPRALAYAAIAAVLIAVAAGASRFITPAEHSTPAAAARPLPGPEGRTSGLNTAAAHRTPTQPLQVGVGRGRGQRRSGAGRASIARDAHRASGVVTPAN